MEKEDFVRTVVDLTGRLSSKSRPADRADIAAESEAIAAFRLKTQKLAEMCALYSRLQALKDECKLRDKATKEKLGRLLAIKKEVAALRSADQYNSLVNKKLSKDFSSEEVLLYASRIANYTQAVEGLRKEDKLWPWSFGDNKIDFAEIEASKMYYMYQGNHHYVRLEPPRLIFVRGTEHNMEKLEKVDTNKCIFHIRGKITLNLQKNAGERLIYTLDGSEPIPNRGPFYEQQAEIITITQNTLLQMVAYKAGFIDSPKVIYYFMVHQSDSGMDQENIKIQKEMERPDLLGQSELGDDVAEGYMGLLLDGDGLSSIHFNGT